MKNVFSIVALTIILGVTFFMASCNREPERILIFSKTNEADGIRHESIEKGVEVLTSLAIELGYEVEHAEDASAIKEKNLKRFNAVVFLNTSHDVLDHYQQADFERFIQAGGGFLGIHGAATTEYNWPWYGKLLGAYFLDHPEIQTAKLKVLDPMHLAMDSIPEVWERTDEWYNFRQIAEDLNVILSIDESSYEGGKNGESHPMAWYHNFDGGLAFYTALGHTKESYDEPLVRKHFKGALEYVVEGVKNLDYTKVTSIRPPDENRFTKVVLGDNLFEPTEMAILKNGKILFIERRGAVKQYDPESGNISVIAELEVHTEFEDGLMGLTLDPDFESNHWVYMYYSPPGDEAKQHLSRFEYKDDTVDLSSEVTLLKVRTQRQECCHTGGSLTWDGEGNLYLSTGDNTNPFESDGYGPMDGRPDRAPFDARSSSANPNDLRGKILRIHPENEGTYTIPAGNLFPEGTEGTRPEIYVMGNRNPYRISVDKRTGYLYWGEVGPDAGEDSTGRGPKGHDEVNQARNAGNFGWPLFVADNKPYNEYNFQKEESGPLFDPKSPVNNSPNNTGIQNLPPSQPAFIWYPYSESEEFPLLGEGGRNAMAGPVYYSSDFKGPENVLPSYFDGKLFIYDWMRGWIFAVTINDSGDFAGMEPFMPNTEFNSPMDMELGPDGVLYMLEYGSNWYSQNEDARLVRIDFNGGNRPPKVVANAENRKGAVPFEVKFSSKGTIDYDDDDISFSWDFGNGQTSTNENPELIFSEAGIYEVVLKITDSQGNESTESLEIWAGNTPPEVNLEITGNQTFFWDGIPFDYSVEVSDVEDGKIEESGNTSGSAWVNIDILEEGFDETKIIMGHRAPLKTLEGKQLIDDSDCLACHKIDEKSIGPEYIAIADKYKNDDNAVSYLSGKIINGGGGIWGDQTMAAHPQLDQEVVEKMIEYILSLGSEDLKGFPLSGKFEPDLKGMKESSKLIIRASYADLGSDPIPSILSENQKVLRAPIMSGSSILEGDNYEVFSFEGNNFVVLEEGGWFSFAGIDFHGIKEIHISGTIPEGSISEFIIFENSLDGDRLGSAQFAELPGPGPYFGSCFASASLDIDSDYFGDIACTLVSDSKESRIGALIFIEFKK